VCVYIVCTEEDKERNSKKKRDRKKKRNKY